MSHVMLKGFHPRSLRHSESRKKRYGSADSRSELYLNIGKKRCPLQLDFGAADEVEVIATLPSKRMVIDLEKTSETEQIASDAPLQDDQSTVPEPQPTPPEPEPQSIVLPLHSVTVAAASPKAIVELPSKTQVQPQRKQGLFKKIITTLKPSSRKTVASAVLSSDSADTSAAVMAMMAEQREETITDLRETQRQDQHHQHHNASLEAFQEEVATEKRDEPEQDGMVREEQFLMFSDMSLCHAPSLSRNQSAVEKDAHKLPVDIWSACKMGDLNFVRGAIAHNNTVLMEMHQERTPLYYAAHGGHARIVRYLLEMGAKDDKDGCAYMSALNKECKQLLLDAKKREEENTVKVATETVKSSTGTSRRNKYKERLSESRKKRSSLRRSTSSTVSARYQSFGLENGTTDSRDSGNLLLVGSTVSESISEEEDGAQFKSASSVKPRWEIGDDDIVSVQSSIGLVSMSMSQGSMSTQSSASSYERYQRKMGSMQPMACGICLV